MTANGIARFGPTFEDHVMNAEEQAIIDSFNQASGTILLDPQDTTAANPPKWSYRGRFMAGKEQEYEATLAAYRLMYGDRPNPHIQALEGCRTYAAFHRDSETGDVKVFGDCCRERWCPMCAGMKAKYAKEQTKSYVDGLKSPKMLTLTLRHNQNDLKSQIAFLQERFRALRSRSYWKKNVSGGIWFLQVKRGENSGCWHPHLHILLDSNRMEHDNLSELWNLVTFGSPVLDIRYMHDNDETAGYVSRYCARPAKLSELAADDRVEVMEALFRKRLCGTFGNAKCVTLTPPKIESDGNWQYVGHYDDVVERAEYDPKARAVLVAYNTYEALSDKAFEDFTGHPPGFISIMSEPKPITKQMFLDFYNTG